MAINGNMLSMEISNYKRVRLQKVNNEEPVKSAVFQDLNAVKILTFAPLYSSPFYSTFIVSFTEAMKRAKLL